MVAQRKKIVILGAGFGGLFCYREVSKHAERFAIDVTLVSPKGAFVFIPMIHEVATGVLKGGSIKTPVPNVLEGCADVVDLDNKSVSIKHDDGSNTQLGYDYLVISAGAVANFFGVPGAREHSYRLKTLEDAEKIKGKLKHLISAQSRDTSVVVVGGGPTGVEIAGEISDLFSNEIGKEDKKYAIHIVDGNERLVSKMDKDFSDEIERRLSNKSGIHIHYSTRVNSLVREGAETDKGLIRADMVIWAAGVKARDIKFAPESGVKRDANTGRIMVNNGLNLETYEAVFIVGDQAWVKNKETGQPYPMRAQFAVREGACAGRNIMRHIQGLPLEEFEWKEKGFIVSMGGLDIVGRVYGRDYAGLPAWLLYRAAYITALVGWRSRAAVAYSWFCNILCRKRLDD